MSQTTRFCKRFGCGKEFAVTPRQPDKVFCCTSCRGQWVGSRNSVTSRANRLGCYGGKRNGQEKP